jgi:hypothetical protein
MEDGGPPIYYWDSFCEGLLVRYSLSLRCLSALFLQASFDGLSMAATIFGWKFSPAIDHIPTRAESSSHAFVILRQAPLVRSSLTMVFYRRITSRAVWQLFPKCCTLITSRECFSRPSLWAAQLAMLLSLVTEVVVLLDKRCTPLHVQTNK